MIAWHHPPESIWEMTPGQVFAWVALGLDREKVERAFRLVDARTAAHSEGSEMQRALKELTGS